MSFWTQPPEPPTKLGRHRQLSPLAGIHVSPICLGGGSLGYKRWGQMGMGETTKESSVKLLDAFYEAGGNFIDTANGYDDGASEEIIGEWMEKRGIRDQMVIATKYTSQYRRDEPIQQRTHYVGNNMKSLQLSFDKSLENLRTSYVDILYIHWWDFHTSVEEVMNGLHNLVVARKVLYLGISDTPAWIVADANRYARLMGKTPFSIYQGAWSILQRDFERDIIPMARQLGLALAPWNVLGAGKIRTDAEEERRRQTGEKGRTLFNPQWERTPQERQVCLALEEVAKQVGAKSITAGAYVFLAIAYVMHKTTYVFPIVGGRKVEHFADNLEALDIVLSEEQIKYLEGILPFDSGFPHTFIGDGTRYSGIFQTAGHFDQWPVSKPILPSQK
ncbi:arylalcohol dehydrogenase [Obba rivulosa]|uniref:Arylalcohol dehydrogenase n=1 Tax=Obba rivulosa TaxID=1052685 RepID=A0A8E2DLJ7_9APHY|nr:arylalcohol dehydrogenase [Obba rivulosa]